jgi:Skp family chaperone for outer membrane proteins
MININKKITLAFFLTFLFSSNSIAETNYPFTSIAIVDINLILTDSKAAKNATKQFETIQKSTEVEIIASDKKIEDEIIASDKKIIEEKNKLIEQQSVIAPEAFDLKAKDFEKKLLNYNAEKQTKLQNYNTEKQAKLRKLEGVLQKARNEILENVKPILEELSQELGVTVILEKNSVLLSANNMDITNNIIKKLNKKLPKIKVSLD